MPTSVSHGRRGSHRTPTALRLPVVMGVLNVTPDSFSDGGVFATTKDAVASLAHYDNPVQKEKPHAHSS